MGLKESDFRRRYASGRIETGEPTRKEQQVLEAKSEGADIVVLRGVEEFVRFIVLDEVPEG